MDNTASGNRRQDDETPHSRSPPTVMSNSTNISQGGSHRATTGTGPVRARPSYATMARKALSDERQDNAAGASPAALRRTESRLTDNQTTGHSSAASKGRQATTEQFDVELDARSQAGKPPLGADNTHNVSAYNILSSKSSSISASKETRSTQREDITNSETVVSSPTSYPSPSSSERNLTKPHANPVHRTASSSIQPPIKPSTPPSSSAERHVTRPHADPVNGTDSSTVQPFIEPSIPHHPPSSSTERNATRLHADPVKRTASSSVQSSIKPSSPYPPPSSSGERYMTIRPADPVKRTASSSVQSSFKPPTPYPPTSSSTERNATSRAQADPVNRTASNSVQPSIKPSTPYPPPFPSSETSATRPYAEPVGRTASVQPPAKPSTPSPPMGRPSASISPSRPAPVLAKMVSNRMHPVVDRGSTRSDELARNDPSAASPRPPVPPEPTETKPPGQDHTSVVPRGPVPPDHIPTTTDLSSRQDRKVPSVTSDRPYVLPEHTPATIVSSSLQDPNDTSVAPSRPPVLPKHTSAPTDPPPNSLSQLVSGRSDLNGSKSSIQRNEPDGVHRGAERTVEGSPLGKEERNRVLAPERENRLNDSANVKCNPTTSHGRSGSSEERDEPVPVQPVTMGRHTTRDGSRMPVTGDKPQRAQRHQAEPSPEGGNFVGAQHPFTSISPHAGRSTVDEPSFSSSERNATGSHAEPVNRTASVQPLAKPSTRSPPSDRPSASISPSSSPPAQALSKTASNRTHPPKDMLPHEPQAQFGEALTEAPYPNVDRGNGRSAKQATKDPSTPRRQPEPPEHIPTTTDLSSRQDRKVPSVTSDRPTAGVPLPPPSTEQDRPNQSTVGPRSQYRQGTLSETLNTSLPPPPRMRVPDKRTDKLPTEPPSRCCCIM